MIDLSGIDLLAIAERDTTLKRVAGTNGGEWSGPCPFCGGRDRFSVQPYHPGGKGLWFCRGCGGERWHDAIDYIDRREPGLTWREKLDRLGVIQQNGPARRPPEPPKPSLSLDASPPPVAWQERARTFVAYAEGQLWGDAGKIGLDWLHRRGLSDDTIRAWGLGWCPKALSDEPGKWGLEGKKVWLPCGVVIPCEVDGVLWYVKVRRFGKDGPLGDPGKKYGQARGGNNSGVIYGLDHLDGKRVAVICEGELDAPLLWQLAGDLIDVVAIGGKSGKPALSFLSELAGASRWLVALDCDADKAAGWWGDFSARVRRVRPLQGNDLTEFHQAGGDLRAWLAFHLDRLGCEKAEKSRTNPDPLLERLEAAWRLVEPGGPKADDPIAQVNFQALLASYERALAA